MTNPIDLASFDFSVSPKESFYKFVNGSWLIKNKIPGELALYGSFEVLDEKSKAAIKDILDEILEQEKSSIAAEFYGSAMDEEAIEKSKLKPLAADLERIAAVDSKEGYFILSSKFRSEGIPCTLFAFNVTADDKNASYNTLVLGQPRLGLPDRNYYLKDEKAGKYKKYLENLFISAGIHPDVAQIDAQEVYEFEKQLAEISIPRDELRDPVKNYNKRNISELQILSPEIQWDHFFKASGLEIDELVLQSTFFFENLSIIIKNTALATLKKHLSVRYLSTAAQYLHKEMTLIDFEFNESVLSGIEEMKPRWKKAYDWIFRLRDLLDHLYVEKNFSKEAKEAANEMVQYILEAFDKRIDEIEWMSTETKQKAKLKLSTFRVKIGYPDKYRDFSALQGKILRSNPLWENVKIISKFNRDNQNSFYGKLVDKELWHEPSFIVNAYYEPTRNEIGFPAGILHPPFFYPPTADKPLGEPSLNFGAIGAIIAHEITHGFDDEGSKYDHEGNLNNWWSDPDRLNFESKTEAIIQQFNEYSLFGQNVNGKLTAGENIADLGGLSIAYKAFQEYKKKNDIHASCIFTLDQEFFISWCQAWRGLVRKDTALMLLTVDVHSPDSIRAEAALSNFKPFHDAFGVQVGDGMFRDPLSIW
ncbi:hypothetical protein HDV01_007162 [Terramyces sp. JEL0728]|nr:hypothetical protein HDV01_007162 [Terramyces sp. JEL0728]